MIESGYGAFSYNQSELDTLYKYIQNQEVHHQTQSFSEEYIGILKEFNIPYDEQYIFNELI